VTAKPTTWDYTSATARFIVAYHAAVLIGLPVYLYYYTAGAWLLIASVALLILSELGIGAAYHRFYSHRAFKLNRLAESVLLFLGTLAFQGSVLRWSYEHRMHHRYVDTDDDPYSINKGFWFAHILWLFEKGGPIDEKRVTDLMQNPLVVFQHRYYAPLAFGSNILVWLLVGWLVGDYLGAFVLAWWTRLLVSHHLTWCINSLAHYWGKQTYSREQSAVDNFVVAFLTVGEGYHNYHHTFAWDYRNGVRWYHFDPVKWTVWSLSRVGLARGLKRVSKMRIQMRLLQEDRRLLAERLRDRVNEGRAEMARRVEALSQRIQERLGEQTALAERIRSLRKTRGDDRRTVRAKLREVRRELKAIRHGLRQDWKAWHRLCNTVLNAPA